MQALRDAVDAAAERTGFSGVVRVDRSGQTELCAPFGFADRAHRVPNTTETQFAVASGSKGLTALAVMSLVERGMLGLGTTVRTLLGADLPLIADDVTVEHLLAHRSGIGDHLDEDAVGDTAFLRSDELPVAQPGPSRRDGLRTNVFHLPVLGNGDGGSYSTAADLSAFWTSLFGASPRRAGRRPRPG